MNELLDIVRHRFHSPNASIPVVVVIGDLMLDRYLWGDVDRISPEAPVPVVRLTRQNDSAGGAGNVAANLAGLGLATSLAGIIGDDEAGDVLLAKLEERGIDISAIVRLPGIPTTTKTRVIGGHQQMLRIDRETSATYPHSAIQQLVDQISVLMQSRPPAIVILSDYAKGVLNHSICQALIKNAKAAGIPILVDPKGIEFEKYQGATGITPNKQEAARICALTNKDTEAMLVALVNLRQRLELDFIALTQGEDGITLIDKESGVEHLPANARQVYDVSGAGDTVIATLAAAIAAKVDLLAACRLANLAAGVVVGKVGTTPIDRLELIHEIERMDSQHQAAKICTWSEASQRMQAWRKQNKKVVFTNGCFDLLHAGHVTYLEQARKLGDHLVVGINTDRSVRTLKGASRPVIGEEDRARVLAALESVDVVILFDEQTPLELIKLLQPSILVKGNDYNEENVVGANEVKKLGGKVVLIPVVPGKSTTNILARL